MMSAFLAQVFGDRPPAEKMIELKQQTSLQTETLLCGMRSDEKLALLGGRRGTRVLLDTSTMRIVDQSRYGANINGIALFAEDMAALGRIGLDLVPAIGKRATEHLGSYREHVAAVECMSNWGARSEGQIVTGSRDGILRCWTFVANLSQGTNLKVARQIQKLMAFGNELLVAARRNYCLSMKTWRWFDAYRLISKSQIFK